MPCLQFIFDQAKTNCVNVCINLSSVSTLITEYEDPKIKIIIKFLLKKNTILSFISKKNKKLQRMSTDFELHSSNNLSYGSGSFYEEGKTPVNTNETFVFDKE